MNLTNALKKLYKKITEIIEDFAENYTGGNAGPQLEVFATIPLTEDMKEEDDGLVEWVTEVEATNITENEKFFFNSSEYPLTHFVLDGDYFLYNADPTAPSQDQVKKDPSKPFYGFYAYKGDNDKYYYSIMSTAEDEDLSGTIVTILRQVENETSSDGGKFKVEFVVD